MKTHITLHTDIEETPRVAQIRGIFDLTEKSTAPLEWNIELDLPARWNIGLIVGPSGCGKSTIVKELWGDSVFAEDPSRFSRDRSFLEAFPDHLSIKEITELLSSVGFSSPPAWLRPYHVLSTGQKFRVNVALALALTPHASPVVLDEFTSVVDRTVAKVGSSAVAKHIRRKNKQFIAVTCHEDVEDWLQPDWIYRPAENFFRERRPGDGNRPIISLEIIRCKTSAWYLFAPHHYLNHTLNPGAHCFLATWEKKPVCFSSWIKHYGSGKVRREHRTVCLPDYQGVGIGNAVSDFCAGLYKAQGYKTTSTTTHPGMIASRNRSANWVMHRAPNFARGRDRNPKIHHATTRLTAGFTYVGPKAPQPVVNALLEDV